MAGNSTGKVFQNVALGLVTIAAGAALGYFVIGGAHPGQPASTATGVQEVGTPPDGAQTPTPAPPRLKPARTSSDYTAPGAPRIHIIEARSPSLGTPSRPRVASRSSDTSDTTDIPTPDAEASQEAAQAAAPKPWQTAAAPPQSAVTTPDTEVSQAGASTPSAGPSASSAPPQTASAAAPPSPGDSEASQAASPGGATKSAGAAQYRIQAGTFADAKNAHDLLASLQGKGIDATLHMERQGGQTVYHVQVGAYHDRAAAEDAASGFRHAGVPVTISPISP